MDSSERSVAMLEVSRQAIIKPVWDFASPGSMSGRSGTSPASALADSPLWLTVRITVEVAASAGVHEPASPDFETS